MDGEQRGSWREMGVDGGEKGRGERCDVMCDDVQWGGLKSDRLGRRVPGATGRDGWRGGWM